MTAPRVGLVAASMLIGWGAGAAAASATPTPAPLGSLLTSAAAGLDAFWRPLLAEAALDPLRPYAVPSLDSYRTGELPRSSCASGTSPRIWSQNARYCDADATILYDQDWLTELETQVGTYAPAAILSHEWGHHIQRLLGPPDTSIGSELQADCYAGMFLASSEGSDANGTMSAIAGPDLLTAVTGFYHLGDSRYKASDWFQPGVHGSPEERFLAFATGYTTGVGSIGPYRSVTNGLDWCLGYADFEPGDYVEIGPYRLLRPPGRAGVSQGDAYRLPPPEDMAFPRSDLLVQWLPAEAGTSGSQARGFEQTLARALPGARVVAPIDGPASGPDPATWAYIEDQHTDGVQSGVVMVLSPRSGSGSLLVSATRPQPVPTSEGSPDPAFFSVLGEQIFSVGVISGRLCGPAESDDPASPGFDAVCEVEQQ